MESPLVKIVIGALAGHGYTLGQNLELRAYGADAHLGCLPQLAKDIAASRADAVVVLGWPPANAMKATGVPTVVAVGAGDPVATGLVASLARPGGNVTGISDNATTLSTKRLELLKQTKPNIRKVAMLWNKDDLGMTLRYQASADAAKSLGSAVQPLGVREPDDFADAFAAMDSDLPDAILMVADALTILISKIREKCDNDLEGNWPTSYYPQMEKLNVAAEINAGALGVSPLSEIQLFLSIATQIINFFQQERQREEINQFLYDNSQKLMDAAGARYSGGGEN